ncbi:MAG TPA: ABC transporter permease [Chloroflexota bacterium]|nr:ABC transporter permease [Chloroflexota bacterium]
MRGFLLRLARRLVGALVMIWAVATFTFFLIRMIPGDPVAAQLNMLEQQGMSESQAAARVAGMYGFYPKDPLPIQYLHYMQQMAHLDLGQSISYTGVPVMHIILSALPYTLGLVVTGIILTFIVGVIGGVFAAIYRNTWVGSSITVVGSILHGIPQFMVALLLAYLLATAHPIFPFGAPYDAAISPGITWTFLSNLGLHAVLPIAAFIISGFGFWALAMKASVVTTLGDDFILAAELRGIKPSIRFRYIARNAFLPLFTYLAIAIGYTFGGAIFIEQIFDYPGLGLLQLNSIGVHDYPLMQAAFLMITVAVIVSNIVAEMLYTVIDPRIRTAR